MPLTWKHHTPACKTQDQQMIINLLEIRVLLGLALPYEADNLEIYVNKNPGKSLLYVMEILFLLTAKECNQSIFQKLVKSNGKVVPPENLAKINCILAQHGLAIDAQQYSDGLSSYTQALIKQLTTLFVNIEILTPAMIDTEINIYQKNEDYCCALRAIQQEKLHKQSTRAIAFEQIKIYRIQLEQLAADIDAAICPPMLATMKNVVAGEFGGHINTLNRLKNSIYGILSQFSQPQNNLATTTQEIMEKHNHLKKFTERLTIEADTAVQEIKSAQREKKTDNENIKNSLRDSLNTNITCLSTLKIVINTMIAVYKPHPGQLDILQLQGNKKAVIQMLEKLQKWRINQLVLCEPELYALCQNSTELVIMLSKKYNLDLAIISPTPLSPPSKHSSLFNNKLVNSTASTPAVVGVNLSNGT